MSTICKVAKTTAVVSFLDRKFCELLWQHTNLQDHLAMPLTTNITCNRKYSIYCCTCIVSLVVVIELVSFHYFTFRLLVGMLNWVVQYVRICKLLLFLLDTFSTYVCESNHDFLPLKKQTQSLMMLLYSGGNMEK